MWVTATPTVKWQIANTFLLILKGDHRKAKESYCVYQPATVNNDVAQTLVV